MAAAICVHRFTHGQPTVDRIIPTGAFQWPWRCRPLRCCRWRSLLGAWACGVAAVLLAVFVSGQYQGAVGVVSSATGASVAVVNGARVLTVQFHRVSGMPDCPKTTQAILTSASARRGLPLTGAGLVPQDAGNFALQWGLPAGLASGRWTYEYHVTETCPFLWLWTRTSERKSVPIGFDVP